MLEINDGYWKLDGKDMPIVTQSAHIRIQKSETNSTQSTVNEKVCPVVDLHKLCKDQHLGFHLVSLLVLY
jgi:hypothetical protein